MYADWLGYGAGVTNYLAVPDLPLDAQGHAVRPARRHDHGRRPGRASRPSQTFDDPYFQKSVTESDRARLVRRGLAPRIPTKGETEPKYTDVRGRRQVLLGQGAALPGQPMQVGPLAQVLVGYARGTSRPRAGRRRRSATAGKVAGDDALAGGAPLDARPPRRARMIRTAVHLRARRQALAAARGQHRQGRHRHLQPAGLPEGRAAGLRLPRGAARHAVALGRHRGRQDRELPGGRAVHLERRARATRRTSRARTRRRWSAIPIADAERPLEVLRTVHSFDPCLACAIHTLDVEGREIARVRAL